MDQLVNLLVGRYGMSPSTAQAIATAHMRAPDDPATQQLFQEAAQYSTAGVSPQELNNQPPAPQSRTQPQLYSPPGAIVMPVGGRPQAITVSDIANAAPPSMSEFRQSGTGQRSQPTTDSSWDPKNAPRMPSVRDLADGSARGRRDTRGRGPNGY